MKFVVTGAAGFIGSNFVHHLLSERDDIEVVSLDALTYAGSRAHLASLDDDPRHTFVEGDVRDRELVDRLLADATHVVNFAAESHVDRSIDGAEPFVSTNVEGTRTLLDAALDTELDRFVQVSTDEVYGEVLDGRADETARLQPRNPYAATKASADLLVGSYWTTHDLPVTITRTCNNFGPRQHPEKLIPKFIQRAAAGEELPLYGDGSNVREWIYVDDNCRAIELVATDGAPGEVYNIGTRTEKTNLEVTEAIIEAVGASADQIRFVEDRPGHDQRYALDASKIGDLGWSPTVSFEEGLERTVEYYL